MCQFSTLFHSCCSLPEANTSTSKYELSEARFSHNCLWWVDLVWLPDAHPAALKLPFLNTWGGNKLEKVWDRSGIKAGSLLPLTITGRTGSSWGILIYCHLKESGMVRNKDKLKHLPSTPFSQVQLQFLTSESSTSSPYPPIP